MAARPKHSAPDPTSAEIKAQLAEYRARGGKIQVIPIGHTAEAAKYGYNRNPKPVRD